MNVAVLADGFAKSNQDNHRYPPTGPQQDLQGEGSLLLAVHLALQVDTVDNRKGHFL